jgi:hypothetical protein
MDASRSRSSAPQQFCEHMRCITRQSWLLFICGVIAFFVMQIADWTGLFLLISFSGSFIHFAFLTGTLFEH